MTQNSVSTKIKTVPKSISKQNEPRGLLLPDVKYYVAQIPIACLKGKNGEMIGLDRAILLQKINDWLKANRKKSERIKKDRVWTYCSYEDLSTLYFPCWSKSKIIRNLKWLIDNGFLLKIENEGPFGRTNAYSVNYNSIDKQYEKYQKELQEHSQEELERKAAEILKWQQDREDYYEFEAEQYRSGAWKESDDPWF